MSENPQKPKNIKRKIIIYLLSIVVIAILLCIGYIKYIDNSIIVALKTKLNIASASSPVLIKEEPISSTPTNADAPVIKDNSNEVYLTKLLELESTINKQQNIINNMKNSNSQILYISVGYQLIEVLKTSQPYTSQKDVFMTFVKDQDITNQLNRINNYSNTGVATTEELALEFKSSLYKNMYLASLYKEKSLSKYVSYYFSKLIMVVNTNNKYVPLTDVRYNLNEIQLALDSGNLVEVKDLIAKTYIDTDAVRNFVKMVDQRIELNNAIALIKNNLYSYVNTRF